MLSWQNLTLAGRWDNVFASMYEGAHGVIAVRDVD